MGQETQKQQRSLVRAPRGPGQRARPVWGVCRPPTRSPTQGSALKWVFLGSGKEGKAFCLVSSRDGVKSRLTLYAQWG